jgi:hypothetical protein
MLLDSQNNSSLSSMTSITTISTTTKQLSNNNSNSLVFFSKNKKKIPKVEKVVLTPAEIIEKKTSQLKYKGKHHHVGAQQ